MSAKIEPGSQADDDRKIRKKIGINSAILKAVDAIRFDESEFLKAAIINQNVKIESEINWSSPSSHGTEKNKSCNRQHPIMIPMHAYFIAECVAEPPRCSSS